LKGALIARETFAKTSTSETTVATNTIESRTGPAADPSEGDAPSGKGPIQTEDSREVVDDGGDGVVGRRRNAPAGNRPASTGRLWPRTVYDEAITVRPESVTTRINQSDRNKRTSGRRLAIDRCKEPVLLDGRASEPHGD
jgi:hypothetical protein